jgi:hypothetical protein
VFRFLPKQKDGQSLGSLNIVRLFVTMTLRVRYFIEDVLQEQQTSGFVKKTQQLM